MHRFTAHWVASPFVSAAIASGAFAQNDPREVFLVSPNPSAIASFGFSSAVADVNQDGITDLAVSAYRETVNGIGYAGKLYILFGPDLRPGPVIQQPAPTETARFGYSMAFGDVNGDSFPDMIATARKGHPGGVFQAGRVFVHYGPVYDTWTELTEPTLEVNSAFGYDVNAGDVNGDGVDDVIIGTRLGDIGGLPDAGEVYVYLGPNLQNPIHLTEPVPQANAAFGIAMVVEDFDGDGIGDLAVGANGATVGGLFAAGEVHLYRGPNLTWWKEIRNPTPEKESIFGYHLVAGDIDGDGNPDLQIGNPYQTVNGLPQAGRVHVYKGPTLTKWMVLEEPTVQANANFGRALAEGDVNADGFDDLVVGVTYADAPGAVNAGEAYVYYGPDLQTWDRLPGIPEQIGEFGTPTVGDVDHDGFGDVFVGARLGDLPGMVNAGWGVLHDFATRVPFASYGLATAGSGAVEPTLAGTGTMKINQASRIDVAGGLGGAAALLQIGLGPDHTPIDGAFSEVAPLFSLPLVLGGTAGQAGAGTAPLPFTLPNDASIVGTMIFTQALIADPGAATGGVAATRGLKLTPQS